MENKVISQKTRIWKLDKQVAKYKELKKDVSTKPEGDKDTLVLEFDFEQNLLLPRINFNSQSDLAKCI